MKKIDLAQMISILANIGVIAGIVFLAIELRQNNESLAVQARLERESAMRVGVARGLGDPAYIGALAKSQRGDALSDEEELLLKLYARSGLVDWQLRFGLIHDGLLDESPGLVEDWSRLSHVGGAAYEEAWEEFNKDTPFGRWMEDNVVNSR
jgi:hypothetical protein